MSPTPKELGFSMPAEWEKHSAVWLAWPHDETTFPGLMPQAEQAFCQMIKAFEGSEKVELIVLPAMEERVKKILADFGVDLSNVNFHITNYADVWTRDFGPSFLINRQKKELGWTKWEYNVYGKAGEDEVYWAPLLKDNDIFNNITLPGQKFTAGIVMEGGAVDVNGAGVVLTTEQCLLNPNRNPNIHKEQTEKYLNDFLGTEKVIWLKEGLINDHTDGHIDEIARFVSPTKILAAYEDNESDENFKILDANYRVLSEATDAAGKPFEVIKLPMPHANYGQLPEGQPSGQKAPVSYANFYVGNKAVLASTFNDPNDEKALAIIQSCFPDKKVVGIYSKDLINGGGAIHCMTQQQPLI